MSKILPSPWALTHVCLVLCQTLFIYNIRQNSREHSAPPNPFVKVDMYPDQLNIDNLGGGGGKGGGKCSHSFV